ncbi:hypothetical protein GCM10025771_33330 [Niveibacterium umoris]|uniref:Phasin family protein n=1 Tax=Niveibacterium umoris TaxID=1193620 RepID=A0A840BGY2_9RHOO|nr:phasin family protein [Niveibacterium umoris]MBB4011474.1 phasin family protein [Niveibacterium umoris]
MSSEQNASIQATQQRNLELATQVAQLSFDNARKMIELQVNLARGLLEDGLANATEAAAISNPTEAMEIRTRLAQRTAERMMGATREIVTIAASAQAEMGKLLGQPLVGANDVTESLQKAFGAAGFNPADAFAVAQKTFDAARSTYEQLAKASMDAMAGAATGAVRKTGK